MELAGEAESEKDAFGGSFMTVVIATVFLFIMVLILEFKTFKSTLIVLSVIPLGIIGGVLMLWLSGNPMSFVAIIGFIGLAGIEVKNSILLVDFTNQLREQGKSLTEGNKGSRGTSVFTHCFDQLNSYRWSFTHSPEQQPADIATRAGAHWRINLIHVVIKDCDPSDL
jgi:hypothetical protein